MMMTMIRKHRTIAVAGGMIVLVGAFALTGCAAADEPGDPPATTGPQNDDARDDADGDDGATGELPCGVVTPDEIAAIVGSPMDDGDEVTSLVTENEVSWTPLMCRWESDDDDDDEVEVEVRIADAAAFADGELVCQEPPGVGADVSPVDGIGTAAWWEEGGISDAEGMLRVCTDDRVIDVSMEADDGDPADFRDPIRELATLILDRV